METKKPKTTFQQRWHHMSVRRSHVSGNSQYRKTWTKKIRLRTTQALWGETTSDQWNLHTKGQQCEKHSSYNSSISGLHILKRPITRNHKNIWASSDYVSLATLLFVQQSIQEKCKNASNFHPTGPFWGESTGDRRNHLRRGQQCEKH